MERLIQVGDLVKFSIVTRIFPHNWNEDKAFADIRWSNPQIAVRWAIGSPIALKSLEKIE